MPSRRLPANVASKGGEFARIPIAIATVPVPRTWEYHTQILSCSASAVCSSSTQLGRSSNWMYVKE